MANFNIAPTTARWLLNLATVLVRQATGTEWDPQNPSQGLPQMRPSNLDAVDELERAEVSHWVGALVMLARTIAGILIYQMDPDQPLQLEDASNFDFGVGGYDDDDKENEDID